MKQVVSSLLLLLLLVGCGGASAQEQAEIEARIETETRIAYEEGYAAGLREGAAEAAVSVRPEAEAQGFVSVTDVIPDALLEMRYYSTFNFVGKRIEGYEAPVALLTREAAEALKGAADDLMAQGYRIKIYDAYRPQAAVDHFAAWAADLKDVAMQPYFYPELDKSVLFERGYIARKSGHSRGSTVDLTLVDMETGMDVDMGSGFDYFGARSHPDYASLTEEQAVNRRILREAMLSNGFRGIDTEWWHYTLVEEPYPDTYFTFSVK